VGLLDRRVLLKDVQNNGKTIQSLLLHRNEGKQVLFTRDGHHSIFIRTKDRYNRKEFIKIWRPYAVVGEDDPENTAPLITILEQSTKFYCDRDCALSHDNSMIAICAGERNYHKVMLYSADNNNKSTTLKQYFSASRSLIRFTLDDNYISYHSKNGLAFWDITSGREITDKINISYDIDIKFIFMWLVFLLWVVVVNVL
jgi:hypothetical protein